MKQKIWFVTGASKGLGLSLVKKLLESGYSVAATSRKKADLVAAVGETSEQFLPLSMDITNEDDVAKAIGNTIRHFDGLDVIVNNAGYGLIGALEELSDEEARGNFEINVFGSLNVIRQALPQLRKQGSGHIFNVASIGGFTGNFPAFGIYCATKFAVRGFTESLHEEVKPFGIHATVVSPGYFRTNFLSSSSVVVPANPIDDYSNVREMQNLHQQQINGNQPGDPEKAAEVMIEVANQQEPPLHLFLGQDAYDFAAQKISRIEAEMEKVRPLATSTGFKELTPA